MSNVQFTSISTDDGQQFITVFADGKLLPPVDNTHPNFERIKAICLESLEGVEVDVPKLVELFDVAKTVAEKFEKLSERVAVLNGVITLDGDPVHGTLQEQILEFVNAGEEFEPLVRFYEKLLTNPLGDVKAGLYDWITGQRANGNFTITHDGDILGYKSVATATPEWRTDEEVVYVPSRRGEGIVNGRVVSEDEFIEQVPGDVVEMPRSRVLHAPSRACGDGLHIGTYAYASGFYGGDTVMLVRFSPRDIVSLPDSNSTWKLRVCRYEVVQIVDGPLDVPVWSPQGQEANLTWSSGDEVEEHEEPTDLDLDNDAGTNDAVVYDDNGDEIRVGSRVEDIDGDEGEVIDIDVAANEVTMRYDNAIYGTEDWDADDLTVVAPPAETPLRHPAQDEKGRFSNGRPGSVRDTSTGRFSA